MDDSRFDDLSRLFGRVRSRRHLVRATLGVLSGAALVGAADAEASTRRSTICRPGGYQCTRDGQCCHGRCKSIATPGTRRVRLVCACPSGQTLCGTRCVDLDTDTRHCGACGRRCRAGESCCDGVCAAIGTPAACAGCGDVCDPGDSCVDGECTSVCVEGPGIDACCDNVATTLGTATDCDDCDDTCSAAGSECYPYPRHADGSFAGAECCDCTDHCGGDEVVYCGGMCPDRCTGEQICNTQTGVCEDPPVCSVASSGSDIRTAISVEGTLKQWNEDDYSIAEYYFYFPDGYGTEITGATPCTADQYCEDNCPATAVFGRSVLGCQCTQYVCDGPQDLAPYHAIGENVPGGENGKYYCSVIYKDTFDN